MKNLICLSVLLVIILCSCKSSSFLNQRYTNFGHGKTKTSSITTTKKMDVVASNTVTKKSEILKDGVNAKLVCENNITAKNSDASAQKIKTLHKSFKRPTAFAAKQFKTITAKHLQVQKEKKSKDVNVYKGTVSKILKIILAILILAIIVGIIIIIVLLM
jgi:hypothetical protein